MAMGMNPNTITAANTIISIRCEGLYDQHIEMEGAQTDAFLSFDEVTFAQFDVGVDGKGMMGFIPHKNSATISLAANSRSLMICENIYNYFVSRMEVAEVELRAYYPSVKRSQTLTGTLVRKSGGTGVGQLLTGHTYVMEGISGQIEEVN